MSHYKAIALALHDYRGPQAVAPLIGLLDRPGFEGHATPAPLGGPGADAAHGATVADRYITVGPDARANETNLNRALKELIVAAMLYRCGDCEGRGEAILRRYAGDLHGHLAAYARHALAARPAQRPAAK
jgi:hypothetical protein